MTPRSHALLIGTASIIVMLLVQWNLTRAILLNGYLSQWGIIEETHDEIYYLPLANEAAKGLWNVGNPFAKEWRNAPWLYPALNVAFLGWTKRVLGLEVKGLSLLFDYAGVFVIAGLTFLVFLTAFRWHTWGYFAGFTYLSIPRIATFLKRPLSPQVNFLPLLAFFIFYFSRLPFWIREIGLAILTGVMFYTYPYHWSFALVLLILSDLWEMRQKKKIVWRLFAKYGIIAACASFYLFHLFTIAQLPYYAESLQRIGVLASRAPAGIRTQILVGICLMLLAGWWWGARKRTAPLTLSALPWQRIVPGLASSLVVLNQQVISNRQMESETHYLPVILIFVVMTFGALAFAMTRFHRPLRIVAQGGALVACAGLLIINLSRAIRFNAYEMLPPIPKEEYEVYDWFIGQGITDAVIAVPKFPTLLSPRISLYTRNYLVFSPFQRLHLMPTAELIDRFTYFDITNRALTQDPKAASDDVFGHFFLSRYYKDNAKARARAFLRGVPFVPPSLEPYLTYDMTEVKRRRETVTPKIFNAYLARYHTDYLVYHTEDRDAIYAEVPGSVVFRNERFEIKNLQN